MSDSAACAHCAEPAANTVRAEDGAVYCCAGCAAAAQWIHAAALDDYYRLRTVAAARVGDMDADLSLWDREDLLAEHANRTADGREITLITQGMRCAACAWLIDRALSREAGVQECSANAVTGRVRLRWDPARVALSSLLQRLQLLGYRSFLAGGAAHEAESRRQQRRELARIVIAALGAMQAMMFAEVLYLDVNASMALPTRDFFRWITLLVATPVVFYAGWPFLLGAWRELRQWRPGMDSLIAGSSVLALVASAIETLRGGPQVWYDAAVMFVFLLLAARRLEGHARARGNAQIDALARARPAFARRQRADGVIESVPLAALNVGDRVCVAAGEALPADATLEDAAAHFEEALLTGESLPNTRRPGEPVLAGSICRDQPVSIRLTRVGSDTRLAQMVRLVSAAQAQRPPLAVRADRIASHFMLVLMLAAAVVYVGWHFHEPARAFEVTLALLVISCPCALSLAVPAAFAAAHASLARMGVLVVGQDLINRLARVTDVVFDKTGTLTDGEVEIDSLRVFNGMSRERARLIAAALEQASTHPIARAFHTEAELPAVEGCRLQVGAGVEGRLAGEAFRLGQPGFAAGREDDGAIWLGDGVQAFARFTFAESLRGDCVVAVGQLRDAGFILHLSSGDAEVRVANLARRLGLTDARSRQSPEDKLALVRALQAKGHVVAMVGDGINDAPVLAAADVSLSFAEGAALAQRASDLILTGKSLLRVPQAIQIARTTQSIIRQNFAWAVGYNLIALPLAASGQIAPWMAALGMALSSLIVSLNALRLLRLPRLSPDLPLPLRAQRA